MLNKNSVGTYTFESERLEERLNSLANDIPLAQFDLPSLNELLGGIYPGQMYALGAMPGTGKTTLMLQEACSLAAEGHKVIFVSAELPAHKLMAKIIARLSDHRIPIGDVAAAIAEGHELHGTFDRVVADYRERIAPNLMILESVNAIELGQIVGNLVQKQGKQPVIILDYLQILANTQNADAVDERLAISGFVKDLRTIINLYEVPLLAISTITRGKYGAKTPNLDVYGGTSTVEYGFDVAMILSEDRDSAMCQPYQEGICTVLLRVLKNRYGPTDSVLLDFDGRFGEFKEHDSQPMSR